MMPWVAELLPPPGFPPSDVAPLTSNDPYTEPEVSDFANAQIGFVVKFRLFTMFVVCFPV